MDSLRKKYQTEVVPKMIERFGYKNKMQVPGIQKVMLNVSFGKQVAGKTGGEREKIQQMIVHDVTSITGQKPVLIKSKKSIAGFKLRAGIVIAAKTTLRKKRMWDFLERLIYLALPRSRDFKGLNPASVDNKGNLSIGFKEHIIFPEIIAEKEKTIFGLEVTVTANAKNKEEGNALYTLLGFPMKA